MQSTTVYDIIGIGIGPFNLGLAALADSIPGLNCLFVDQNKEFNWHPGMMLDNARLQVPFYADLVTLADPCSQYSYLAFLKAKQRMFRFAILENNFILRKEYNVYCQWVVSQLRNLYFGFRCEGIQFDETDRIYSVCVKDIDNDDEIILRSKRIVIGVGSVPYFPECLSLDPLGPLLNPPRKGEDLDTQRSNRSFACASRNERDRHDDKHLIFHSSDYLYVKERLLAKKAVTIVGSGQSAAEIFYDLLHLIPDPSPQVEKGARGLNWFTRAERFYPMEYSRLSLEMTSPDYVEYFYGLSPEKKRQCLLKQDMLYKGINFSLINSIYDELYLQSISESDQHTGIFTHCSLKELKKTEDDKFELSFHHSELEQDFTHVTEAVILATGYQYCVPDFIEPIKDLIGWTDPSLRSGRQYHVHRNYSIDSNNSIFVQNAELHTHGFNAPDLGMGPYRNAVILNSVLGYEHFGMEKNISFQTFGKPQPPASS